MPIAPVPWLVSAGRQTEQRRYVSISGLHSDLLCQMFKFKQVGGPRAVLTVPLSSIRSLTEPVQVRIVCTT